MMTWQCLEERIRKIASFRWDCNAVSETIAGIKCDCILKPSLDQWVAIEITERRDLDKIRSDITKLRTIKNALILEDIYCMCYIVTKDKPTDSMRTSGESQKIKVVSADEFQNEYFNYDGYIYNRSQKQFGSLINTDTGKPEINTYTEVSYINRKTGAELKVIDIVNLLKNGKKVLLKGDFGLGKSRCVKEVFDTLISDNINNPFTIAINLRDCWGLKRGIEILNRHFDDLGLEARAFIKSYENPNIIYLLDGFDEIGTQSWSSDPKKMHHIREMSVCALKDLINHCRGGVLITGREYYFNSDKEMLECLGLDVNKAVVLECHSEFTETQLISFMKSNMPSALSDIDSVLKLPPWFPKRPLVIQLMLKYASEIFTLDYALDDICGFWYAFFIKICEREANIYPALNPHTIGEVLIWLANKTRVSQTSTGPITQNDLSEAFTAVTGLNPNDESAIMLQRLPTLGRISADSPDRQFLDLFILNALRAESIIKISKKWDERFFSESWLHPLDATGCSILAEYISKDEKRLNTFLSIARRSSDLSNNTLAADIVSSICLLDVRSLDFQNLFITDAGFIQLSFEGKEIMKLSISNSTIERLDLANAKIDTSVSIDNCIINTVFGIASNKSVPKQISNCSVDHFELLATTTLIKRAHLSVSQKLFVESLRKIFFQPGAGRKENALHRGMGSLSNKQITEKILNRLLDEGMITRHKGDDGYIYKPVRKQTRRVEKMLADLTLSEDPLWKIISNIN